MKREPTYVGVDVAKDRVDIAVRPTGQSWSASYEEEEVEILVARLRVLEPAGVILASYRWPGAYISSGPGCGITASGSGQSPPSA